MSKYESDLQQIKNDIMREVSQQQFQYRQEILKLQQMIIDREDKSKEVELKVSSFDNKLVSLKNMIMTEMSHTKENLLQEPKKIMRDFEVNVKHIYDMKFKSLEAQFIGIMDEQAKLNRLTQLDQSKRQEEISDYYNKFDRLIVQNTEKNENKFNLVMSDVLNKFNKMEDTFLELFKQKEKLFERMNLGYEHLFSNQEIIESTIKKIIYTLDRKADNLSVRTYLKNVKIDLDTKFEDYQNSLAFPRGVTTGTYLQDKTNQSAIIENINTLNMSDLKILEGENTLPKLLNKLNQQSHLIKAIKETQSDHENRIDHLEEITMNIKLNDQNSQISQLMPNLKQRVNIYPSNEDSIINQTPITQRNRNNSPQTEQTPYYQNIISESKSIIQKSDFKEREQSSGHFGNQIVNDIFGQKQTDKNNSKSNNNQNSQNKNKNLIFEAFDQSASPDKNREIKEDKKYKNGDTNNSNNNILQNNFMQPSEVQLEKNEKLPQCLEQDEGEELANLKNKNNNQNETEKLKLTKSVAQDRMTSTNVPNRMRQNFDQKQKVTQRSNSAQPKRNNSELLKESEPLDQGFIDIGDEILTNSLKKPMNKKEEDSHKTNNHHKKPQIQIEETDHKSKKNNRSQNNFKQTISPPPEDDYDDEEEEDETLISGGGLRNLLNKSKNRQQSRDNSPIQNSSSRKINQAQNFNNLNEIDLLNQEYKNQMANSNLQQSREFNQSNQFQKTTQLDNKSNQNKGGYYNQNNSNLNNTGRQGQYFEQSNSDVYDNPLDRRNPLPKKQDLSNSSLLRNKSGLMKQPNDNNNSNTFNNNKYGNQYSNKGMYNQNNQQYDEDEEVVYQIDEDGFLMDEVGEYLRDEQGNFIRLSPDQLDNLRDQNLVVEEEYY